MKRILNRIIFGLAILVLVWLGVYFLIADVTRSKLPFQMTQNQEGQITLTGRLIPNVNTGMRNPAGIITERVPDADYWRITEYEHPFVYFLYDAQHDEVQLSFTADSLVQLQQQFVGSSVEAALPTPEMWHDHPEYIATTALWRDWAGQWVSVRGEFGANGVFHVNSIQSATSPSTQAAMITRYAEFIDTIALIGNLPYIYDHNDAPFMTIEATREDGLPLHILVYSNLSSLPRLETRVLFRTWSRVRGWRFNPPRSATSPDLIEVQSIEEIPAPRTTISPPP